MVHSISLAQGATNSRSDTRQMNMLKTTSQIRYENFDRQYEAFKVEVWRSFPDEPEKGMLRKFAVKAGLTDAYCSHIKCRRKPMGARTARKVEGALGLPANFMDHDHAGLSASAVGALTNPVTTAAGVLVPPGSQDLVDMMLAMFEISPEQTRAEITRLVLAALKKPK